MSVRHAELLDCGLEWCYLTLPGVILQCRHGFHDARVCATGRETQMILMVWTSRAEKKRGEPVFHAAESCVSGLLYQAFHPVPPTLLQLFPLL